jgi:hypothetical protein
MENFNLDKDITVFYETAISFPNGVLAAHQKLHALIPFTTDRRYFGISRPEGGGVIVYRASAEELFPGEGDKLGLKTLVMKKGTYTSEIILNYHKNLQEIQDTFQKLLENPKLDPQGYCVELYLNYNDMRCMVRLHD